MTTTDTTAGAPLAISVNDDSVSSASKTGSTKKHYVQHFPPQQATPTNRTNTVDERDKASFYKDLYHFHDVKGTPIPRPPRVNGHEIDLHKFYSLVCSRGGWAKINYRNEWEDLVPEFDLPSKCVNASVALKQIYMRFLDRYEKIHFLGEDNDRIADETDEDNRHKKWNNKHFNDVPMKYNYAQHHVAENMRATHKLSTDLYKTSEYERLLMSLMSPLPNEQDFAVNVCTLMANESRHTLKVERCPKLLDALMGHAGVYSHHSMRELFHEYYSNVRKHSLQSFWNDCLHDKPDILELTYEDYFEVDENLAGNLSGRPPVRLRHNDNEIFEDGLNTRSNELNEISSLDFLNLKRGLGTHDYIGQRVHQVSTICRNLSFFDENLSIIVKNRTFVRFLVMCANIRWGNLHQMGLDTLGNIAIELDLCDPNNDSLTKCLLATIAEGLESPDRGVIISCLEILYKLCQKGTNEEHLHKYLDKRVYRQICMYLSLNDIMLLLYTLECLFALSSMGEKACFAIVQLNGVIDTLVSLVSVEAQSYGPDGCILMRVVETVPTPIGSQHQGYHSHHQTYQQTSTHSPAQTVITQLQSSPSANHVVERNPIESRIEVKCEPRPEIKPVPVPVIPQQSTDVSTSSDTSLASQQHALPSLPSPPPTIVQSVIPTTSISQAPIITPVPKPQIQQIPQITQIQQTSQHTPQHPPHPPPQIQQHQIMPAPQIQIPQVPQVQQMPQSPQMPQPVLRPEFKINQGSNPEQSPIITSVPITVRTMTTAQPTITTAAPPFLTNSNVVYSEQQMTTIHTTTAQNQNSNKLAQEQENEQFALAWLRATFEPVSALASRIEQQDLYKMYLTACSKIGRTGVVSQYHFPRCVRNVFGGSVGPNQIKIKQNAISSFFYEGIRIRAQPLAVVHKGTILQAAVTTTTIKAPENTMKKDQPTIIKTPIIQNQNKMNTNQTPNASSAPILQHVLSTNQTDHVHMTPNRTNIRQSTNSVLVSSAPSIVTSSPSGQSSSSLIKAILANKVTTVDGTVIGTPNITTNMIQSMNPSIITATSNMNVHQVAQRQHLQKQREAQLAAAQSAANSSMNMANVSLGKDPKATIVIKTPTGNVPPNMKATITGNTLIPATMIEKKAEAMLEAYKQNWDPVPPLAPLSGSSIRQTSIITSIPVPTVSPSKVDDDSNSTNLSANSSVYGTNPTTPSCQDESEGAFAGFEGLLVPGNMKIDDDGDLSNKRKIDANANPTCDEPAAKRSNLIENVDILNDNSKKNATKSSSSAANLYAKLAASLLEDEDMELDETPPPPPPPQPVISTASTMVEQQKSVITVPMQRQIIVSPNNARQQMIIAPPTSNQQMGQATATIKTDGGYQTVPVILQHGNNQMGNIQIQKQIGGIGQQIIQPVGQTQYMLATNQQGQTYLVAQQQPPPVNQILLTQTSQQQGGAPTKTIIILQQQTPTPVNTVSAPQKVIMTTQQGQQMIVTQVPRQHHVIVNQHSGNAGANVIQSNPQMSSTNAIISQVTNTPISSSSQPQLVPQMRAINSMAHTPVSMSPNVITTSEKKKVFVTGSGNIEVTQVSQPISHPPIVAPQVTPNITSNVIQKPVQTPQSVNVPAQQLLSPTTVSQVSNQMQSNPMPPKPIIQQQPIQPPPIKNEPIPVKMEDDIDVNWLYVCDWRGCQRRKFRSANEVYLHACAEHCPDNIDPNADIYCQWGPGPNLCDNLPRKRFSLMTHINDRHITLESFKAAVQRRIASGPQTAITQPVTIIKKPMPPNSGDNTGTASPTLSTSSNSSLPGGSSAAMQAIKRHSIDLINPKELMFQDENEGPVTKSIRLTASLILRNLVNYTTTAKRCLRYYEPHLSSIALSNVESSRTIAQVLYEMNETRPY